MPDSPPAPADRQRRERSRFAIAVLAINGIVGAGIFGVPGKAAGHTGAFSPLLFLVCGYPVA